MASLPLLIGLLFLLVAPVSAQEPEPFIPRDRQPITAENIDQLELLGTVGRGWQYRDVAWSPDGETIAVPSAAGVVLFDAESPDLPPTLLASGRSVVRSVSFDLDQTLVVFFDSGTEWAYAYPYQESPVIVDRPYQRDRYFERVGVLYDDIGHALRHPPQPVFTLPDDFTTLQVIEDQGWVVLTGPSGECGDREHQLALWNFEAGIELARGCTRSSEVVLSPDRRWMLLSDTYYPHDYPLLWNVESWISLGDPQSVLLESSLDMHQAAFSSDSQRLALISYSENYHRPGYGYASELLVWTLEGDPHLEARVRAPDTPSRLERYGNLLYFQGAIWDLTTGHPLSTIPDTIWGIDEDFTRALTFAEEVWGFKRLFGSAADCEYVGCEVYDSRFWDLSTGQQVALPGRSPITRLLPEDPFDAYQISPNGQYAVSMNYLQDVLVRSGRSYAETDHVLVQLQVESGNEADIYASQILVSGAQPLMAFSPNSEYLVVFPQTSALPPAAREIIPVIRDEPSYTVESGTGGIVIWRANHPEDMYQMPERIVVRDYAFSPNGQFLAVNGGASDNRLVIYDLETGQALFDTAIDEFAVDSLRSLVFSSDSRSVLGLDSYGSASSLVSYSLDTQQTQRQVLSLPDSFHSSDWLRQIVGFDRDRSLMSIETQVPIEPMYYSSEFQLWDIKSMMLRRVLPGAFAAATPNWDLIVTEDRGFAYLWGIPANIEP